MKINKLGKTFAAVILGATMGFSALAFTACDPKPSKNPIEIENPTEGKVTVSLSKNTLTGGSSDTVSVSVTVENLTDKGYSLSLEGDGANYVQLFDGNKIKLVSGVAFNTEKTVTVKATSTVSALVSGSAILTLKPQVIHDVVDELTTEMFEELGSSNITVSGMVTDIVATRQSTDTQVWNNKEKKYDYTVKMDEGAWYGEWSVLADADEEDENKNVNKIINNYRRSEELFENSGKHTLNQVFVNKNNQVDQKIVKDYKSIPSYWENQHLWNHISQLGVDIANQWKHDETNDIYIYQNGPEYNEDKTDYSDDMYLRLYLAISMTPMLDNYDTLDFIAITVEEGKITKMEAQTVTEYNTGEASKATSMSYTVVTFNFSDIGTTEVPEPAVYEADAMTPILDAALEEIRNATNYTFNAVENTISAPSVDPDDYTDYSLSAARKGRVANGTSSSGTVGLKGQVTEEAVLLSRTGKYEYGMDENLYWTEHTGYKQVESGYFDFFEYSSDINAFQGKQKFKGSIADTILPKFDFAAELFEFVGDKRVVTSSGIKLYPQFALKEPAITRDVAKEVSMHSYASNAANESYGAFVITLDENDKLYSIEFPYNISGNYLGILETTFSKIGSTGLPEDWDGGYAERVIRNSWAQYPVKYYHPDHNTTSAYGDIDANELLNAAFGVSNFDNILRPIAFYNVFDDTMTEAFFEWDEIYDEVSGEFVKYQDYISFNLKVREEDADENLHVDLATYKNYINALTEELATYGFVPEPGYPNEVKNSQGEVSARYMVYTKGNVAIEIENNTTRFFFVDIKPISLVNV